MKEKLPAHLGSLHHRVTELQDGPDAPPKEISRRQALLTGMHAASFAATAGLAAEWAYGHAEGHDHAVTPTSQVSRTEIHTIKTEEVEGAPRTDWWKSVWYVTPKALVGKNVDNALEWGYIHPAPNPNIQLVNPKSLPKILPPTAFHENLAEMLAKKEQITKNSPDAQEELELCDSLSESYTELFLHEKIRKMDLREFRALITKESRVVLDELKDKQPEIVSLYISKHLEKTGWKEGTEGRKKYEEAIAKCLQGLAEHITPNLMLAYILTELMPAKDKGVALFEHLIEHAGVEFIERIPSEGDNRISFGPFQLTTFVIGKDGSVTHMLKALDSHLLPETLGEFTSIEDHIRAGLLFAFENVMVLVQELCKEGKYEELKPMMEAFGNNSSLFLEFISAAHHRPGSAYRAMKAWLAKNKSLSQDRREPTLTASFTIRDSDQEDKNYADRSRHFLEKIRSV